MAAPSPSQLDVNLVGGFLGMRQNFEDTFTTMSINDSVFRTRVHRSPREMFSPSLVGVSLSDSVNCNFYTEIEGTKVSWRHPC